MRRISFRYVMSRIFFCFSIDKVGFNSLVKILGVLVKLKGRYANFRSEFFYRNRRYFW